jgi:hypothetical protein
MSVPSPWCSKKHITIWIVRKMTHIYLNVTYPFDISGVVFLGSSKGAGAYAVSLMIGVGRALRLTISLTRCDQDRHRH